MRLEEAKIIKAGGIDPKSPEFNIELEKRVAKNPDFKAAQKTYDPFAKAFNKASEDLKDAHAKFLNAQKDVANAKTTLEYSKSWSLYSSDSLALSIDREGAVIAVLASPVYGSLPLNERLGSGALFRTLTGELDRTGGWIVARRAR